METYVLSNQSQRSIITRGAGNKGRFLFELSSRGLPVPRWSIVSAAAFRCQRSHNGLARWIDKQIQELDRERTEETSRRITEAIVSTELVPHVRAAIAEALALVGDDPIAVRSSGLEEDGEALSFAGQFDSFLGVTGLDAVEECVKKCWASAYSERALVYRQRHGLDVANVEIAVVLQRLVNADVSGVAFTVNPASGNPFETVISAVYGLGEGLVSGAVDADVVTVDKYNGMEKSRVVGAKHQRHDASGVSDVPEELRSQLALSGEQIDRVRHVALEIERALGKPQDIEWCFEKGSLWLLQARPVTGRAIPSSEHFDIWDNSNIIENYPGITSHLTFTFARHLYGRVFLEYCRLLALPEEHLREMEGFLDGLLGYTNGRVYYNLLHWYKLVGVNPFQTLGRRMMEVQMGVNEALDLDAAVERIRPYHPRSRAHLAVIRLVSGARFFSMVLASERHVATFKRRFYELFADYDAIEYSKLAPETVFSHYKAFERKILSIWGITVSLESAIGLPYGLLRMLTRRWIPSAPPWFEAGVIGGVTGVESIEPARRMDELADRVRAYPALEAKLLAAPSSALYSELRSSEYREIFDLVQAYIRDFGYRANNELKLEEPDMAEEPAVLFDLLKVALAAKRAGGPLHDASSEQKVERILSDNLNAGQRAVFDAVRSLVRGAIRRRETVRFCRSRTFGVFRKMFLAMGRGLAAQGILENARDVFHLTREELDGCFDAGVSHRELKPLVAQRKNDARVYETMEPLPQRFVSRGPIAAWLKWFELDGPATGGPSPASTGELRGTACSPGTTSGRARVVKEPTEFDGGILVTYRTDPGWISVFPSAKALLVERGSPLTHAAIVARELGIPTIVQIPGLTRVVKDGMELRVDADRGQIFAATQESAAPAE